MENLIYASIYSKAYKFVLSALNSNLNKQYAKQKIMSYKLKEVDCELFLKLIEHKLK